MTEAVQQAAPQTGPAPEDLAYQEEALQDVSRTFALTIPQLPEGLRTVVANAYLLCRIADTIEDCERLTFPEKRAFYEQFFAAVEGEGDPQAFAEGLYPRLEDSMLPGERKLIQQTPAVLRITHSFGENDRAALSRCVRVMAKGMEAFQEAEPSEGLRDQRELDAYCYYVAGVVGEMLTELFCHHSEAIAARRDELAPLAVSFGQGLQMTNILKDIWDDLEREVCWLPRDTFADEGLDLGELSGARGERAFEAGLERLVARARGHLENALEYTLTIPPSEKGVRQFCLWAIGMALLTLRKVHRSRGFTDGASVKISRRSVRATVAVSKAAGGYNGVLRILFRLLALRLPPPEPVNPAPPRD